MQALDLGQWRHWRPLAAMAAEPMTTVQSIPKFPKKIRSRVLALLAVRFVASSSSMLLDRSASAFDLVSLALVGTFGRLLGALLGLYWFSWSDRQFSDWKDSIRFVTIFSAMTMQAVRFDGSSATFRLQNLHAVIAVSS